ncbi:MAG: hypothetical protein IPJ12_19930 [Betaproteobacteria bacterium]|nr:hypothetical protein [Betaproteobacteria bacterium]
MDIEENVASVAGVPWPVKLCQRAATENGPEKLGLANTMRPFKSFGFFKINCKKLRSYPTNG